MKKLFYFLAIFALVLAFFAVVPVSATSYKLQATQDPRTPPFTPTPYNPDVGDFDFSCPAGVPVGYGTVQPNPSWLANCSHCLPTATPFSDDYEVLLDNHITCHNGQFGCFRDSNGNHYALATSYLPSRADVWFQSDVQDIIISVRFAGYDPVSFGSLGEDASPSKMVFLLNDEIEQVIDLPVSQLPATYEFPLTVAVDEFTDTFSIVINDDGSAVGHPDYMQNFGCSRIYITADPEYQPDGFSCPLYAPSETCYQLPTPSGVGGNRIDCYTSPDDTVCEVDNDNYIRMTLDEDNHDVYIGFILLPASTPRDVFWRVTITERETSIYEQNNINGDFSIHRNDTFEIWTNQTSVLFTGDGTDVYDETTLEGTWTANNGTTPPLHYRAVYKGNIDWPLLSDHVTMTLEVWSDTTVSLDPDPCVGGTSEPSFSQPLTGSYCSAVVPLDHLQDLNVQVFENSPSSCITIPYASLGVLIPDWLQLIIQSDFLDWMETYLIFPASTLCYHFVTFHKYYFFNVGIDVAVFAFAALVVYIIRRLTLRGS